MGVVYRAVDGRLNRSVAVKLISPDAIADPDRRQRFLREARAASVLSHPNIVTIHDIGRADDLDYLVMELVSGTTLERQIPPQGLPVDRVIDWGMQILSALATAHAAGIVHRDIKPANIMVTDSGQLKLLDFGLAKRLDRVAEQGATTIAVSVASDTGSVLGTVAYLSPEQAQGEPIDGRTDIFSCGAVLYEMLAGRRAFGGQTAVATLSTILSAEPPPLEAIRTDVPPDLARLVHDCLKKDRESRPHAAEALDRLAAVRRAVVAPPHEQRRLVRRPAIVIALAVIVLLSSAAGFWRWQSTGRVRWARNVAVPEIERLAADGDFDGVYRLGREAIEVLPDDPRLKQLWLDQTFLGRIETNPPGAAVEVKGYLSERPDWIAIGRSPVAGRLPFGPLRVRLTRDGYLPLEVAGGFFGSYTLDTASSSQPGMVRVNAATLRVGRVSLPVKEFWIDKYEVTNRQYKEFVDKGGYRLREYWKEPIVDGQRTLSWEEAMTVFRDSTGRPGPAGWELGTYGDDHAEMPVTGISWYEAAAYAAFAGKRLPTAFHWRAAAGMYPPLENFSDSLPISNFGGKSVAAVGTYKGLGSFGTYDLAGNVKEWCWNETPRGRMILGGGWNETSYMFMDLDAQPPMLRQPAYGMRLMKEIEPADPATAAPIPAIARDLTREKPVDDAAFQILRSLYDYDATPLNATVDTREETPAWRKETVSYDAPYGKERIVAYLFLPKNVSPPYQTIVYFPGGDAVVLRSSRDLPIRFVEFVIRSGRAVLFPVYKGTFERGVTVTGANALRDVTIARVKDVKRSMDYLVSRPDVDPERLGFYGVSLGAAVGVLYTAMEPRLKASVLMGGGLSPVTRSAEVDSLNFAPRIRVPTLMVNGRSDFAYPYETSQLPLFGLLGPSPDRKQHATFEGGHIPFRLQAVIGSIVGWFDRYLGSTSG